MSPELESKIYGNVLRAVLEDKERAEVFKKLQVNGITGTAAEEMFRRARSERIAVLRNEAIRATVKGAFFLAGGVALFSVFWFGFGWINRFVFVISGLLGVRGTWLLVGGATEAMLAPSKRGAITPGDY
jgi:hypothetical protein